MQRKKLLIIVATGIFVLSILSVVAATGRMMGGGTMGEGKMCGMMERIPKTGVKPENLPDADSSEAKIYARFCSQCHALPSPKRNSAEDWKELVERMDARMRMMSRMGGGMMMMGRGKVEAMSAPDKDTVIQYLQKKALKTLDKSAVSSLDTPEYLAFERVCSQCHDLPDPSAYTKSEWPKVVQKMKENMSEMDVERPGPNDEKLILKFLGENSRTAEHG